MIQLDHLIPVLEENNNWNKCREVSKQEKHNSASQ